MCLVLVGYIWSCSVIIIPFQQYFHTESNYNDTINKSSSENICYIIYFSINIYFRLRGDNEYSERLNKLVNDEGEIHITPTRIGKLYVLRMAICSRFTESDDIQFAYEVLARLATQVLNENGKTNGIINGTNGTTQL